jgi:hypothetical protein
MRTTLTLDDDVAALLKRVLAGRRDGLKAVVNEALRQGLLPNVDHVAAVLALTEGDQKLLG